MTRALRAIQRLMTLTKSRVGHDSLRTWLVEETPFRHREVKEIRRRRIPRRGDLILPQMDCRASFVRPCGLTPLAMTSSTPRSQRGFTLIELVVVIVIIGILASVALRSGRAVVDTVRIEQTKTELDALAAAMVGNPELTNNGIRADFGYVGDVGALPPNLDALYTNPGGYSTWNGPYIAGSFTQVPNDFKTDAWGSTYDYDGGTTIVSTGSGDTVERRIADSPKALLRNRVSGVFLDADGTSPGDKSDSVTAWLTIPNGSGGTVTRSCATDAGGYFSFDSIPVGNHSLALTYPLTGAMDTLTYLVSVSPGTDVYSEYRSPYNVWQAISVNVGLVAYWRLDDGSGTTATDASGNGYHGTLVNMAESQWVTGQVSGALRFDGSNDYITAGNTMPYTNIVTVAAWVKPASLAVDRQIVSKGYDGVRTQWELKTTSAGGQVSFRHWAPGEVGVQSVHSLAVGVWTHLAGTYDGTTWRIYWNGVLDNQNPNTGIVETDGRVMIGAVDIHGTPGQFWYGEIDDVRMYDRVLTADEVAALAEM